jgi:Holliday junction DNA helicase RuvA
VITFLRGSVVEAWPMQVVLEVQGVGYQVEIPLSTYEKLPQRGGSVTLLTHLQIREDAHVLYGFATAEERDLFRLLIAHVSGVGPKIALSVLNGMLPVNFRGAVVQGDIAALSKIKGLGKKTAERIVVELRDKVGVSAAWEAASAKNSMSPAELTMNDAVLALIALGYKQIEAAKAVKTASEARPGAATEDLVREALKLL